MKSANSTCSYSTITFIACTQRLLYSYPYITAESCVPHEVNPDLVTWHLVNSHAREISLAQVDLETLHGLVCLPTCTVQSCLSRPEQPHHGSLPYGSCVLSDIWFSMFTFALKSTLPLFPHCHTCLMAFILK